MICVHMQLKKHVWLEGVHNLLSKQPTLVGATKASMEMSEGVAVHGVSTIANPDWLCNYPVVQSTLGFILWVCRGCNNLVLCSWNLSANFWIHVEGADARHIHTGTRENFLSATVNFNNFSNFIKSMINKNNQN